MAYGQSPWQDAGDSATGVNYALQNMMMQSAQQRWQQQKFMQEQMMQQQYLNIARQRAMQEGQLHQAQMGRYQAQGQADQQDMQLQKAAAERAKSIGQLQGYQGSPVPMQLLQDPQQGPQIINQLRSAGVLPQGRMEMTPEMMMQAVQAAQQAQMMQQGMQTPQGVQHMMMSPYQQGQLDYRQQAEQDRAGEAARRNDIYGQRVAGQDTRGNVEMMRRFADLVGGKFGEGRETDRYTQAIQALQQMIQSSRGQMTPNPGQMQMPFPQTAPSFPSRGALMSRPPQQQMPQMPVRDQTPDTNFLDEWVVTATNPATGQKIKSRDGGQTWEPAQ